MNLYLYCTAVYVRAQYSVLQEDNWDTCSPYSYNHKNSRSALSDGLTHGRNTRLHTTTVLAPQQQTMQSPDIFLSAALRIARSKSLHRCPILSILHHVHPTSNHQKPTPAQDPITRFQNRNHSSAHLTFYSCARITMPLLYRRSILPPIFQKSSLKNMLTYIQQIHIVPSLIQSYRPFRISCRVKR
jgi:hypothetical protein